MEHATLNTRLPDRAELDRDKRVPKAHKVMLEDVEFTANAKYTIGLAVKEVAAYCGLMPRELTSKLKGHMFWMEGTQTLTIIFPVEELGADMMVEIPREHWRFRHADDMPSQ